MNSKDNSSFLCEDPFVIGKKLEFLKNYLSTPFIEATGSMFCFLAKHVPAVDFRAAIAVDSELEPPPLLQLQTVKLASHLKRKWNEADGVPNFREPLLAVTESTAERLCRRETPYCRRLAGVAALFNMQNDETEFLTALYCVGSCSDFRSSFTANILADRKRAKLEPFTRMLWPKQIPHMRLLEIHGRFARLGLTDEEGDLLTHVILYLMGKESRPLNSAYFTSENKSSLALDQFAQYQEQIGILRDLLRCHTAPNRPLHLLFYGPTGTGKTELAKALAGDCGRNLFRICQEDDTSPLKERADNHAFRLRAINACTSIVDPAQSLILIDEADDLLNDGKGFGNETRKALVNELMDRTRHVCIWITNHHRHIEESTRRRFDYSIAFESLSYNARLDVWKTCLRKYDLHKRLNPACTRDLGRRYRVNAGAIEFAVRNAASLPVAADLPKALEQFLEQNVRLMHDGNASPQVNHQSGYSLAGLNVAGPVSPEECTKIVTRYHRRQRQANAATEHDLNGLNVLLTGPPGTGKTAFARYLARRAGTELIVRTAADILSCWVGGTEENLRSAFDEAQREEAILFFDEIDGILSDRSHANRNWEVTQINELLTCMENHTGVFLAATNFRQRLDTASTRRFTIKFEFDYLDSQGKRVFWRNCLAPLTDKRLAPKEAAALDNIPNLTPGDFHLVANQQALLSHAKPTNMDLIDALAREVAAKNPDKRPTVGFGLAVEERKQAKKHKAG